MITDILFAVGGAALMLIPKVFTYVKTKLTAAKTAAVADVKKVV